ncbi:unnamed protein product [Meloidogyne enterolobii]|uniref:Uncharacterized protein n=1 Tax=Meloidogyne enterolobii TaxID=390850 RepID=A0ACB1AGQ8_MELEN
MLLRLCLVKKYRLLFSLLMLLQNLMFPKECVILLIYPTMRLFVLLYFPKMDSVYLLVERAK